MEIKNTKDAQNVIEGFEALQKIAVPIAETLAKIENMPGQIIDEEILIEEGELYAKWETYCCGGSDYHELRIPLEYLFDEDWKTKAEADLQRRKDDKEESDRIAKEKYDAAEVERAREEYLKLRNRFEGES